MQLIYSLSILVVRADDARLFSICYPFVCDSFKTCPTVLPCCNTLLLYYTVPIRTVSLSASEHLPTHPIGTGGGVRYEPLVLQCQLRIVSDHPK